MDKNADQIYIDKVLKGDANAYAHLINKYKDMTYTLAMKIVKNHEDAEEVAQDSFLKAYEKLDSFKGDSKFSTWLYTIVYRNSITKIRKKKVATSDIDDYVMDNYSEGSESPQIDAIKGEEQKKYVKEAIYCPHPEKNESEFIKVILEYAEKLAGSLIIPVDELIPNQAGFWVSE